MREKKVTKISANTKLTKTSSVVYLQKDYDYITLPSVVRNRKTGEIEPGRIDIEVIGLSRGLELLCEEMIEFIFWREDERLMVANCVVTELHDYGITLEVLHSFFKNETDDYIVDYETNRIWKNGDIIYPKERVNESN